MTNADVLLVMLMLYCSLTLGVLIKFVNKGVRPQLLLWSPLIPLVIIFITVKHSFGAFKKDRKFSDIIKALIVGMKGFPVFTGVIGYLLTLIPIEVKATSQAVKKLDTDYASEIVRPREELLASDSV
ncbi:MAG: hypothetical protein AB1510_04135 [Bacillota bacterium]